MTVVRITPSPSVRAVSRCQTPVTRLQQRAPAGEKACSARERGGRFGRVPVSDTSNGSATDDPQGAGSFPALGAPEGRADRAGLVAELCADDLRLDARHDADAPHDLLAGRLEDQLAALGHAAADDHALRVQDDD